MLNNKRQYYRINLQVPLSAQMKIIGINHKEVTTKISNILIPDISAGGIRIHSKLNLPEHLHLLIEFRLTILNKGFKILGQIARKNIIKNSIYDYGIIFIISDEQERNKLQGTLNLLSIRLRHSKTISSCSFCSEEELIVFYGESVSN